VLKGSEKGRETLVTDLRCIRVLESAGMSVIGKESM
jgi:hypothetical protein